MFSRLHMIPSGDNTDTDTDSTVCYNESCVNNRNKDLVGKLAESFHLAPAKNLTHMFISCFFPPCFTLYPSMIMSSRFRKERKHIMKMKRFSCSRGTYHVRCARYPPAPQSSWYTLELNKHYITLLLLTLEYFNGLQSHHCLSGNRWQSRRSVHTTYVFPRNCTLISIYVLTKPHNIQLSNCYRDRCTTIIFLIFTQTHYDFDPCHF